MILKKIIFLIFVSLLTSCSSINFVYEKKNNATNPLLNKTDTSVSGKNISTMVKYTSSFFGKSKDPLYKLNIFIEESKLKRSVQKNQAITKLDYELVFNYSLNKVDGCLIYEKSISSRFSYVPKSSGYNFGSDQSLDKLYDLSIEDNFNRFFDLIGGIDLVCKNES